MDLKFEVFGKIAKPVSEVFDAVYNPGKLSGYFTTGGASAPLDEGTRVKWDFHDYPGAFPVRVDTVERNKLIVLHWKAKDGDYETEVHLRFEPTDGASTMVRIGESGWKETQKGLDASYGNCIGWMQMICCLKVYVERGENLREFFF